MKCVTLQNTINVQITVSGNQISVTSHSSGELMYTELALSSVWRINLLVLAVPDWQLESQWTFTMKNSIVLCLCL